MDQGITSAMLPQLPMPSSDSPLGTQTLLQRMLRGLLPLLLVVGLVACSAPQPSKELLNDALVLQIQLTQTAIATSLDLAPMTATAKVKSIHVDDEEPIRLGEAEGVRVSGHFDWQLPGDPIHMNSPFEVVLERGERGQSWRLAQPSGPGVDGLQTWMTYPLGLERA